jgi:hypothetical protein
MCKFWPKYCAPGTVRLLLMAAVGDFETLGGGKKFGLFLPVQSVRAQS